MVYLSIEHYINEALRAELAAQEARLRKSQ